MPFYYHPFLIILIPIIILLFRFIVLREKNISVELFFEALKDENNGHFEAAVVTYESALNEASKTMFHGDLKNKIIEKIKILHTSIEFKKNLLVTLPGDMTNIDRGI
jgi:hypothetical protein